MVRRPEVERVAFETEPFAPVAEAVVAASPDAIVTFDENGTVTGINETAVALFQCPAGGAAFASRVFAKERWHGPLVTGLLEKGTDGEALECVYHRPEGGPVVLEVSVQCLSGQDGRRLGAAAFFRDITAWREFEQQARDEHRRLEEAQSVAKVGSFEFDLRRNKLSCSRELQRLVGLVGEAPSVQRFLARLEESSPGTREAFREALECREPVVDMTFKFRHADGDERWFNSRTRVHYDEDGKPEVVVGSLQDITDSVREEEARRLAERQFSVAFEQGSVGMCIVGLDRLMQHVNPRFCLILGRSREDIIGHSPDEFTHPDDVPPPGSTPTESVIASGGDYLEFERRFIRPDGEGVDTIVHLALVRDESGSPMYTVNQVVDITDRKRAAQDLERLAMQDSLTGLPNRTLLQDRLETALARSRRSRSKVAVIFVDVDHFKFVNDSLGHPAGDQLLVELARRLRNCTRGGDTVARFGGDEFVLVCEEVFDIDEATVIGERVRSVCEQPVNIDGQPLYFTVSAGIVMATDEDTPATLLRDADTAMYRAKENGRARAELFDPDLRHRAAKRLDVEMALRRALEEQQFHLVYQPVLAMADEVPFAVEALIRWDHPEEGVVPPLEFIPTAEESGLIVPIGEWVLDEAIRQNSLWRRTLPGAENLVVAVNVSPRQLVSADLVTRARNMLVSYGLPADGLCIEVTESAAMDDVDFSLPLLRRIAESGIRLAVDDFGVGYSSLTRLKRLPVNVLKIDRSFVDGLGTDSDDSTIVHAIVSLGQALGLRLCAEGVETEDQRKALVELGCHSAQGFYWSKPLRPEEFEQWFLQNAKSR